MSEVPRKKRVLLTEIGSRTMGDEALYHAAVRRFCDAGWSVSLSCRVVPRNEATRKLAAAIHELIVEDSFERATTASELAAQFARRHPQLYEQTRTIVRQQDLVAIAPGGRFTTGYNNPRALLTAAVALELGVPLVHLHQSFGPLKRRANRRLLTDVLSSSLAVLIRDDCSQRFLSKAGVPDQICVPTRDAAFAETFSGASKARYEIGINIRHGFNGHARPALLRRFLQQLRNARPASTVLVFSTTHAPDHAIAAAASGLAEVETQIPGVDDALAAPSACRVIVSDSFHGMIFGMMARRPVIPCQTDFGSWKIQGTRTPDAPDFNVLPGLDRLWHLPALLRETLRALDDPQPLLAAQEKHLDHGRTRAEAGWRELFQRLETIGARFSNP